MHQHNPDYQHKSIEEILDEKVRFKDNRRMFYKEMKQNFKLETICILACETGEWGTEILAYAANLPLMNEVGILGGVLLGGSYALYHVYKHAKAHNAENASLWDAAGYAASTESGCIIGATLSEYSAGKFVATTNNPIALNNVIVRGAALLPAFGIGLCLMSAFTYNKKKEIARWVGDKGILPDVKPKNGLEYQLEGNKLEINGENSNMIIREKKLPRTHRKDHDMEKESLFTLQSKLARAKPEYAGIMTGYCEKLLTKEGHSLTPVSNIYVCSGSHGHKHDEHEYSEDEHGKDKCGCGHDHNHNH